MAQVQQSISSSDIGDVLEKSLSGIKLEKDDCIRMLRSPDVHLMGMVAGHLTQKLYGKRASFVNNIILNYTNVCITDCKFCAFYRPPGHDEAYTLTLEQIESRVKTAWDMFGIKAPRDECHKSTSTFAAVMILVQNELQYQSLIPHVHTSW